MARRRNTPITASVSSGAAFVFTASISGGAGNGINGMLRKEFYVVRKKYHVVRKLFYVASIFGGAAGRRNRPPWELSSTASRRRQRLQCVYRAPVFSGGAHTSLPDTNIFETTASLGETRNRHLCHAIRLFVCRLRKSCEGCPICQIFSSLTFLVPLPFACSSSISRKPPCRAVNISPHPMSGFTFRKNKPEVHFLQGFGLDDFAG